MSKDETFSGFGNTADAIDAVVQIMRDIETGFNIGDRSVSRVSVERTNDGHGWAVKYGTDYDKETA